MKKQVVIFLFTSPLSSGCDYVQKTMRIVARESFIIGIALGDVVSVLNMALKKDFWIFRKEAGGIIIRPVSLFPLRWKNAKEIAYICVSFIVRLIVAVRFVGVHKFLWFFEPFHLSLLLPMFAGYESVYDCVDYYPGFNTVARREHENVLRKATMAFANSQPLAKKLWSIRKDTIVVPCGVSCETFCSRPITPLPHNKVLGYVGGISARIDFSLLLGLVKKFPLYKLLLVGPYEPGVFGKRDDTKKMLSTLLSYKNVTWVPWVSKEKLPEILESIDVALIPYDTKLSFNRFSNPMKTYEYLACGRPVVSTNIAALYDATSCGVVSLAQTQKEFLSLVQKHIHQEWGKSAQEKQRLFARTQSWEHKVAMITKHLIPLGYSF